MTAPDEDPLPDPSSILTKAFQVLRVFTVSRPVMTLTEVSRASGLPKSTAYRLLERLAELDAVVRCPVGYSLSFSLTDFDAITPAASGRDIAMPHLLALHRLTGSTVSYGVLRQRDVVYLEKLQRHGGPVTPARRGARLPANCTAIGKALLAWEPPGAVEGMFDGGPLPRLTARSIEAYEELRAQLTAVRNGAAAREQDEATVGLSGVAAAIIVSGHALAALSVSFPSGAAPVEDLEGQVISVARRVASDMGTFGRPLWSPVPIG